MADIFIGTLGGTIAMTRAAGEGGVTPKLTAADLLAAVPGLDPALSVQSESVLQVASASISLRDMGRVLDWANRAASQGARAVILTQGTDSMEETAWFLDLFWAHDCPLIVTGAMRAADGAGPDGPANLAAALRVAQAESARGRGVMVVMNEVIHSAKRLRKTDSLSTDTFSSGTTGPLGRVIEGAPVWFRPAAPSDPLPAPQSFDHDVAILSFGIGQSAALLRHALSAPEFSAVVLAGFGSGHLPADLMAHIDTSTRPVIYCSRCGDGPATRATYGYPGSEVDLQARGVWPGDWLGPLKARILIWAIEAAGLPDPRAAFEARAGV